MPLHVWHTNVPKSITAATVPCDARQQGDGSNAKKKTTTKKGAEEQTLAVQSMHFLLPGSWISSRRMRWLRSSCFSDMHKENKRKHTRDKKKKKKPNNQQTNKQTKKTNQSINRVLQLEKKKPQFPRCNEHFHLKLNQQPKRDTQTEEDMLPHTQAHSCVFASSLFSSPTSSTSSSSSSSSSKASWRAKAMATFSA